MSTGSDSEVWGSSQGPFCSWQGVDFPGFLRLMQQRPPLSWAYALRLSVVAGCSLSNSVLKALESLVYGRQIRAAQLTAPPVFILGHWRSGTTLLHNLMSLDPQFNHVNLYQVINPHHFLLTEKLVTRFTKWLVPKTRPMDDMAVSWGSPQEDETALCNMTLTSAYMMLAFSGQREKYGRYFDMQGVGEAELARWKAAFLHLLKKLAVRDSRSVLLKSPPHTYRIPLLLELFPDAKFVYIYRNPYAVFSSSCHLRKKIFEANAFAPPDFSEMEDDILKTYEHLFERYEADKHLIPASRLHEVRYEDLDQNPVGELAKIYSRLQLDNFSVLEAAVEKQMGELRTYRKNRYVLDEAKRKQLYDRLQPVFERYGYPAEDVQTAPARVA